eukprot:bmy_02874T0
MHLSAFSLLISDMNKKGKIVIKLILFIEKMLLLSIGQWQVGEGRFTSFTVATEPILYSFRSFLRLSTFKKTFSKHAWELCSEKNVHFDRGLNLGYQGEYRCP